MLYVNNKKHSGDQRNKKNTKTNLKLEYTI